MPLSGKELVRRYKKAGWAHVRTKGSHYIMQKEGQSVSIPVHGDKSLHKGLESKLLKNLDN